MMALYQTFIVEIWSTGFLKFFSGIYSYSTPRSRLGFQIAHHRLPCARYAEDNDTTTQ